MENVHPGLEALREIFPDTNKRREIVRLLCEPHDPVTRVNLAFGAGVPHDKLEAVLAFIDSI